MFRQFSITAIALLTLILLSGRAYTAHSQSSAVVTRRAVSISQGLRMTLALPGSHFYRDALELLNVSVTNVSHHTVYLARGEDDNPYISVLGKSSAQVYPPALQAPSTSLHTAEVPQTLDPGQTLSHRVYVVMRGSQLRVTAVLDRQNPSLVQGRIVSIHLDRGLPLQVVMHNTGTVSADVLPSTTVFGPLLYQSVAECANVQNNVSVRVLTSQRVWTAAPGTRLAPAWGAACAGARQWHVAAGWLGHPIAMVTYINTKPGA